MQQPLSREDIARVIEGRGCAARIPLMYHFWIHTKQHGEKEEAIRRLMESAPCDIDYFHLNLPVVGYESTPAGTPVWNRTPLPDSALHCAIDNRAVLPGWEGLAVFLQQLPSPHAPGLVPSATPNDGRYRLACFWHGYFERMWQLRGMENALMDFFLYPDEVHRLFSALTDFYMVCLTRAREELGADGIFTSDDIGTQTGPFFSLDIFREFFLPYYTKLFRHAHKLGMHFWLHSCGNIESFLPGLIEAGLDVLHPIQKYTMDETAIAQKYGNDICFWYGFDVQQTIPRGTPEDVRAEVRRVMDIFRRGDGRFMMTMGNGSTPDWPPDNLSALFGESLLYGQL